MKSYPAILSTKTDLASRNFFPGQGAADDHLPVPSGAAFHLELAWNQLCTGTEIVDSKARGPLNLAADIQVDGHLQHAITAQREATARVTDTVRAVVVKAAHKGTKILVSATRDSSGALCPQGTKGFREVDLCHGQIGGKVRWPHAGACKCVPGGRYAQKSVSLKDVWLRLKTCWYCD